MVNISMAAAHMDIASQAIYFDINCRQYARLATFLDDVKTKKPKTPTYFCRPVPPY